MTEAYQQRIKALEEEVETQREKIRELNKRLSSYEDEDKIKIEKKRKATRYWTPEEHQRFLEALAKFGRKEVKVIAEYVGSRTETQVRTHAQKYFLRMEREELGEGPKRRSSMKIDPTIPSGSPSLSDTREKDTSKSKRIRRESTQNSSLDDSEDFEEQLESQRIAKQNLRRSSRERVESHNVPHLERAEQHLTKNVHRESSQLAGQSLSKQENANDDKNNCVKNLLPHPMNLIPPPHYPIILPFFDAKAPPYSYVPAAQQNAYMPFPYPSQLANRDAFPSMGLGSDAPNIDPLRNSNPLNRQLFTSNIYLPSGLPSPGEKMTLHDPLETILKGQHQNLPKPDIKGEFRLSTF